MIGKLFGDLDEHGKSLIGADGKFCTLLDILDIVADDILSVL